MHISLCLFLLCTKTISSQFLGPDLIKPLVACRQKSDCEKLAFSGEYDCLYNKCYCIKGTTYKVHLGGCFKNIQFDNYCNETEECITPDAICAYPVCNDKIGRKKCICKNDAEYNSKYCKPITNKCCSNADCEGKGNMYCNPEMQRCQCLPKFHLVNETCIPYKDFNICDDNDDCTHMQNTECEKKNTSINLGTCKCKINYINIQHKCVKGKDNSCNRNKPCSNKNENCFFLPNTNTNNTYGICYEGLICREHEINLNNQCFLIEDFCRTNEDCKEEEICFSNPPYNTLGNCVKGI